MPTLSSKVKKHMPKKLPPLWEGPQSDGPQGGVTQSLLGGYVCCKERFRVKTIEGLKPADSRWNHRLGYGSMWHCCEEELAQKENGTWTHRLLDKYTHDEMMAHPLDQETIEHWYYVCRTQFPIYVDHWRKHPDVKNRTPLLQEETFCVPYKLPSGRVVYLRGKFDSVDLIKDGRKSAIFLQENKTKSDIEESELQRQLMFDLQTGVYLCALELFQHEYMQDAPPDPGYAKEWDHPIAGVRYNVVRRPLSGGAGSIRRSEGTKGSKCNLKCCKYGPSLDCEKCGGTGRVGAKEPETQEHFYKRVREVLDGTAEGSPGPEYFFMRWKVDVTASDLEKFKVQFLNPCLEDLCDDYEWWEYCHNLKSSDPYAHFRYESRFNHFPLHVQHVWRLPYGLHNPLIENGSTELDEYLDTGSTVGLTRAETLFKELE